MGDTMTKVDALTQRQKEILRLVSQHLQAKEVARALNISERTVKTHTDAARKRLGVATSRDAARLLVAHEAGLGLSNPIVLANSPIVLEGRWPSRPIGEAMENRPLSGNEQAIHTERTPISADTLERSIDRLADAGSPRQTTPDRGDLGRGENAQPERGTAEDRLHRNRGDRLVDRRWPSFERQLATLNVFQWVGLIAFVGVLAAIVMSGLFATSLSTLQMIEALHRQAG